MGYSSMVEHRALNAAAAGSSPAAPAITKIAMSRYIGGRFETVMMQISWARPPNYDAIVARFPLVAGQKGVFFCYGNTIHNPDMVKIPDPILVHEQVHSVRQGGDPEKWWRSYLEDDRFRLNEELPAHIAEYWWWKERTKDRNKLAPHLAVIAGRLSSPLYGNMISLSQAMQAIRSFK